MLQNWILLAALGGLASNGFNFFNRYFLKDQDDASSWAWAFETLRLLFFAAFALTDFKLVISPSSFLVLSAFGLTEFISVYLYMKMHAYSHLSVSSILSRTRMIWIPVIAFFFFGERLKLVDYLGIVILFAGLSTVVAPHKMFVDKGAIYANLAAIVIALNTVIMKMTIPYASTPVIMIAMSLPSFILFPILMRDARKRLTKHTAKNFPLKILAAFFNVASSYLILKALELGDVSKVNAIYQSMMITSVLAGIIFLRERQDIFKKLIGTVITIFGVLLLTG